MFFAFAHFLASLATKANVRADFSAPQLCRTFESPNSNYLYSSHDHHFHCFWTMLYLALLHLGLLFVFWKGSLIWTLSRLVSYRETSIQRVPRMIARKRLGSNLTCRSRTFQCTIIAEFELFASASFVRSNVRVYVLGVVCHFQCWTDAHSVYDWQPDIVEGQRLVCIKNENIV